MKPVSKIEQPVVRHLADFDRNSGWWIERVLFNHRGLVFTFCLIVTVVLGYNASKLRLNASFEKTIPTHYPFIVNYLKHKSDMGEFGNAVRIAIENKKGTIYDASYLDTLEKISDEVFLLEGVDRPFMKSLWTPNAQWFGVTEQGFAADPIIPNDYSGSPQSVEDVRRNVGRSGEIGQIVAMNQRSSIVFVPLLPTDENGNPLDYGKLTRSLEQVRSKYSSDAIAIHITGFAEVQGDLIAGLHWFLLFFIVAILVSASFLLYYTRCWRATGVVVCCSLVAVLWQLGLLALMGFVLDPYSILVPFLIFAIGMSHGSQKMNGILQDVGRGTVKLVAARYTFRRLFTAGLTALLADAVGFAVLAIIRIQAIQELALTASIGVAILIITNLIMVPILLSYAGVSTRAAERSLRTEMREKSGVEKHSIWSFLDLFTRRKWATVTVLACVGIAMVGYVAGKNLKIGDLDPGAPELRPDSLYNRDAAFMHRNYGASSDIFAVMVETPNGLCAQYDTLMREDALEWQLRQLKGVESTNSLALLNRQEFGMYMEGSLKWYDLTRDQYMINTVTAQAPRKLFNLPCNLLVLSVYLKDHKADTLTSVVDSVEKFAPANNNPNAKFILGAGSAGIDAATNIVVKKAKHDMLYLIYGAVILLCLIAFRSWRAAVVAVLPLVLTSILCEALMVWLGMGVKVATLPVIALGVGIGVDYALYMLSVTLDHIRAGESLSQAYYATLCFTGRVVLFTGFTLAVAVITWAFSPIKFQADTGILLAFMFLWNMLGALILLPALAYFLLPRQRVAAFDEQSDQSVNAERQSSANVIDGDARNEVPL